MQNTHTVTHHTSHSPTRRRQFTAFAKQYALEHGPIILEMDTYRCDICDV
jgi:hypothetical protein